MTIYKKSNYLKDYEIVKTDHNKEVLVYRGNIYLFNASYIEFKRYKRIILGVSIFYIILWILATIANPSSLRASGTIYVIIPYVAICFPISICLHRSIRLQRLSQRLEKIDYDLSIVSLNICTIWIIALGIAAAVCQITHIVLNHALPAINEWIVALCFFAISAVGWFSYRLQGRYSCENIGKGTIQATT